ncbi:MULTISPECIES: hypothetical protein [Rhodococcus]|uniref:Uncharacterized protein n=1 Tax=Rhodococcus opacus RKJ300 = JCM 13270 TaxID=1165867 RepID=I0W839_RHOOP|nr:MULTISPECIES: hypothetical protein [Rhodococcus]EID72555.1 hypothetical protein W59_37708 [Rhodococcus opacus RKJ300 = JCM 13270]QQZ14127.1 hypothetical protein GO592_31320 [Rhodococcus sp. 21391]
MIDTCHGTLIVHTLYGAECTDESCVELSEGRHALIIDCDEFGDCVCSAEFAEQLRHAS